MMKAYFVYVSLSTRVVVDDNTTEQDIIKLANANISYDILSHGIFENVEDVIEEPVFTERMKDVNKLKNLIINQLKKLP